MNDSEQPKSPRRRTARWAWVVVLGMPLIAIILIIYARLVRPTIEVGVAMQVSEDSLISFLPTRGDDFVRRYGRVNHADCDGDGIPEIGFEAAVRYGGVFEGIWSILNVASYVEESATRVYSVVTGSEVFGADYPFRRTVRFLRPDGMICIHADGEGAAESCAASRSCQGDSFPNWFEQPWQFQVGGRVYEYRYSDPGTLLIEDMETHSLVFSEVQQSKRIGAGYGFGSASVLWHGAYLEFSDDDIEFGQVSGAQVFRFSPTKSIQEYPLPDGCVPMKGFFESVAEAKLQVTPDQVIKFLATIEEPRGEVDGEFLTPMTLELVEIQLGTECTVRPVFNNIGDGLYYGGSWQTSGAVACDESAFWMGLVNGDEEGEAPEFRVLTPWLDHAATFTCPEWVPTERLRFKSAHVLPDVDADGIDDCLMVWFGSDEDTGWGLISFVLSGATGQPVRRDAMRLPDQRESE